MTEHLPECLVPDFDKSLWICICNQLRACEARVSAFYSAEIERQGAQWEKSCRQFYRSGSDDGRELALDAAREAVAPMEAVVLRIAATLVRHPSEDDLHDALQRHWCGELKAALFQYRAAIDALKESND